MDMLAGRSTSGRVGGADFWEIERAGGRIILAIMNTNLNWNLSVLFKCLTLTSYRACVIAPAYLEPSQSHHSAYIWPTESLQRAYIGPAYGVHGACK